MKCLGNGIDGSLYVDDFLICYQSKEMNIIQRHLQLCLNKFKNGRMKMVLNFPKQKLYVCIFAI